MTSSLLEPQLVRMPAFGPGRWLNTPQPLTRELLRDHVVLVDFWDYTCVNCLRTLPYLQLWHERYADLGLALVGVHAPEFRFARHSKAVEQAVSELDIHYPVLLDSEFVTWTRYANRAWPTKHIVDHQGYIRFTRQGEGYYQDTERAIQTLLRRRSPELTLPELLPPLRSEDASGAVCYRCTPELHAGYSGGGLFGSALGNPEGFVTDGVMLYALPDEEAWEEGQFYLEGFWRAWPESVALAGETAGTLLLPYSGAGANAVLSPSADPVELMLSLGAADQSPRLEVRQDGAWLTAAEAGADVVFDAGRSVVVVDRPRMYSLTRNPDFGRHTLELRLHGRGLALFTVTFESCLASDPGRGDVFVRP